MQAYKTDSQKTLRTLLIAIVLFLGSAITVGSVYVQQTPALSLRWARALLIGEVLAYHYRDSDTKASEGDATMIPVLTYHRIVSDASDVTNVTVSRFRDQMTALKKAGWQTVRLQELEEFLEGKRTLPDKSFVITFDDGTRDSFYPVDPVLSALGFSAVNFIIVESSNIKKTIHYLKPEEVRLLLDTGRWDIGSHSFDGHRPYPVDAEGNTGIFFADKLWRGDRLETDAEFTARVYDDLLRAQKELETLYGVRPRSFAFPLGNETGIYGANNFPAGSAITEYEAAKIYDFGYVQTNNQQFTSNVPRTLASSPEPLQDPFLVFRIHVDYDWDGARLLTLMENGRPKLLPFEDDFSADKGWILSWGTLERGRNNFILAAGAENASASAFLDGSQLWRDYSFDAAVTWERGHAIVLGDVVDAATYHACVFSPGEVKLQMTRDGKTTTVAARKDARIRYGTPRIGVRVHGERIECTWEFSALAGSSRRDFTGGVGLQVWDAEKGSARLAASSVIARPLTSDGTIW